MPLCVVVGEGLWLVGGWDAAGWGAFELPPPGIQLYKPYA